MVDEGFCLHAVQHIRLHASIQVPSYQIQLCKLAAPLHDTDPIACSGYREGPLPKPEPKCYVQTRVGEAETRNRSTNRRDSIMSSHTKHFLQPNPISGRSLVRQIRSSNPLIVMFHILIGSLWGLTRDREIQRCRRKLSTSPLDRAR